MPTDWLARSVSCAFGSALEPPNLASDFELGGHCRQSPVSPRVSRWLVGIHRLRTNVRSMGFYDTGSSSDGQADNCQQNEGLTGGTKASDIHMGGTTEIEKMARIRPGFVARNRNFARLIIRSQTNMATGIKGYCFRTAPDASLSGHGENASTSSGCKIPGTSLVADREWEPSGGKTSAR